MRFSKLYLSVLVLSTLVYACTPKVSETVQETTTKPETPKEEENLSPCPKFSDAPNPGEIEDNYVIYRDFLKRGSYDQAFELWQKVYEVAPAADGKRTTVYEDGIYFYKRMYSGIQDSITRLSYENAILEFFDEMAKCYGDEKWVGARKAFEMYYTFGAKDKMEIYNLFKSYIEDAGLKTQSFAINPFTALLVELTLEEKVSSEDARLMDEKIKAIIEHNIATKSGQELEGWQVVESYAPARLSDFETVKGFYDCTYYQDKYYPNFEAAPDDCDVIREVYSWLKWGGCSKDDSKFAAVVAAGNENCVEKGCFDFLKEAQYSEAIQCLQEELDATEDVKVKAKNNLLIAKIYYSHLKNFSKARDYAQRAAEYDPNWGEPYLLIGRLYASSGPLCGPGRGWDSQVVTWVAIDMWTKAKAVDPSAAAEANQYINRYSKYMPTKEDIFQRTLTIGEKYFVPCWIQRTTTIRPAP
jgi:tetratricopeptide (TPR) repeat protein